jgi:hypothetical protein
MNLANYTVKAERHFGPKIWGEMRAESERKRQHFEGADSTRPFGRWRELRGIVAEETIARQIGVPRHGLLVDGGTDFFKTDVKGAPPAMPVLSVVPVNKKGKPIKWRADYYVCVAVDLKERWATILGWALRDEIRSAPLVQLKHSKAHVIYPWDLRPGLPEELVTYAKLYAAVS